MKAYLLIRTRCGISGEAINEICKSVEYCSVQGRPTYGWYDAVVELEAPNINNLSEIVSRLKHNQPNIDHIGTAIERI